MTDEIDNSDTIEKIEKINWSATDRAKYVRRLQTETFDLIIVGGGITGAGIAREAALRGIKTALVDKEDSVHISFTEAAGDEDKGIGPTLLFVVDVDKDDVSVFLGCMSGENVPADPNCAN